MAWMDVSQAAFELGISERTLRNWVRSGKLKTRTDDNGRRMVEIPDEELEAEATADSEAFGSADAHADGEAEEGSFAIQKRLEIALLECGRVKGTLASQERIMENLTGNVSELSGKLQRAQSQTWKLILALLVVAFLGVVASYMSNAYYRDHFQTEQNSTVADYAQRLEQINAKNDEKIKTLTDEKQAEVNALRDKQKDELMALQGKYASDAAVKEEQLKQEFIQKAEEIEERYKKDIEYARELKETNTKERDNWEKELSELRAENRKLTRERDRLNDQVERNSDAAEDLKTLKRDYRELELELSRYRRKLLEAGIEPEKGR